MLTTAVHSFGIVMLSLIGVRVHAYLKGQRLHFWQAVMILTVLIAAIGLSLAVLHGLEAAVWAGAYLWLGASDTLVQALLFSVDSMTTRGASGLVLHQRWQFMGALEAVAGMLMFGISTAYFFRYCCFTGPTYKPSGNAMKRRGHLIPGEVGAGATINGCCTNKKALT